MTITTKKPMTQFAERFFAKWWKDYFTGKRLNTITVRALEEARQTPLATVALFFWDQLREQQTETTCRGIHRDVPPNKAQAQGGGTSVWSIRSTRHPVKDRKDINELDNLLPCLLKCPPHCDSWVREEGASPSRSRRCKWGRNP